MTDRERTPEEILNEVKVSGYDFDSSYSIAKALKELRAYYREKIKKVGIEDAIFKYGQDAIDPEYMKGLAQAIYDAQKGKG